MSDPTDNTPPRQGGSLRDEEAADAVEPSPETAGVGFPDRSTQPAPPPRGTRWRELIFEWLDETISRKAGEADSFYLATVLPVMDRLAGIGTGLIAMIMVADRVFYPILCAAQH